MPWLVLAYLCWVWLLPCLCRLPRRTQMPAPLRRIVHRVIPTTSPLHHRAKPQWVRDELIGLAARSGLSCRKLMAVFNRRHMADGMRVGKTFVDDLLRAHAAEIRLERLRLKRRVYGPGPRNVVWGMDGTGKTDEEGKLHFLLGIVDHGTRRCVTLEALHDKRSVTLVRALCDAIEQHGTPKVIRTDNEAIFQSQVFKTALKMLGIRHETTELHCPWQNGRIERFFGTLKGKLDRWAVADGAALNASLVVFRLWYNHVRTHQHLGGCTPMEAWNKTDLRRRPKPLVWFEGWDGLLQGEYLQR
jgi:putative transposase